MNKTIIGAGALLGAATVALLVANANAGDRVLLVRGEWVTLTNPQKTSLGSAVGAILPGSTPANLDSFECARTTAKNCDDAQPPVCVDVATVRCEGVDTATLTPTQYYAAKDSGTRIKLLAKNGSNVDVKAEYINSSVTGAPATSLASFISGVFSVADIALVRALHCKRTAPTVIQCRLADYRTVAPAAAVDLEAAGVVIEDMGVVQ